MIMDFDSKSKSKTSLNYDIFRSWNGNQIHFEDESELLFLSPERSPQHYKNLSPSSKTKAVARGQRELMDMVSQMPESFYELSLRDMVENPMVLGRQKEEEEEINIKDKKEFNMRSGSSKRNKESRALIHRNKGGLENEGFYLKMGFPKSLRTTKKVKNSSAKVSPRPFVSGDKDWWKKRFSRKSESESVDSSISSRTSVGSGSNINRKSGSIRQVRCGCWSWI